MRRIWKWAMIGWSVLMVVWAISLGGTESRCDGAGWLEESCRDGEAAGAGLALILILFVWTLGMVLLGVAWRVSKPERPEPIQSAGWHPDPRGEHRLRWWDGRQWTGHVSD